MLSTALNNEYDLVVVGAGIAGLAAAVKAGAMGRTVLLVEHYAFVGGMSSAGMVSPFMKSQTGGRELVRGVFEDLELGMRQQGGMIDNGFYAWAFRSVANQLLQSSNVHVAFNTDLVGANLHQGRLLSVQLATPQGLRTVSAQYFIDTSGDAQLLSIAGLPWRKGDEKTGKLQALTLFFRMGGMDVPRIAQYSIEHPQEFLPWMDFQYDFSRIISIAGFKGLLEKSRRNGQIDDAIEYVFFTTLPSTGEGSFNCTNILGIDPSSSSALTQAERIGHRQVGQIVDFLVRNVPGFEQAYLLDTAIQVGVRETRRAVADYMMTGDDILRGARFPDVVARACYGIDIHGQKGEESRMDELEEGHWYDIPLRSLLVSESTNVLVAGRCIGATREGQSALRIMPTAAATGEACGAAAALALQTGSSLRALNYQKLKAAIQYNLD